MQVNSSSGKWCVAQLPLDGDRNKSKDGTPRLEFVTHNGQGDYDKPETGDSQPVFLSICSLIGHTNFTRRGLAPYQYLFQSATLAARMLLCCTAHN